MDVLAGTDFNHRRSADLVRTGSAAYSDKARTTFCPSSPLLGLSPVGDVAPAVENVASAPVLADVRARLDAWMKRTADPAFA
jgi:hypothetical protein